jgi:hypothetical protein
MDVQHSSLTAVVMMQNVRMTSYGASIWVRRRRRSEWMAAADSEGRIVAIRSAGKQFLIVARAAC